MITAGLPLSKRFYCPKKWGRLWSDTGSPREPAEGGANQTGIMIAVSDAHGALLPPCGLI